MPQATPLFTCAALAVCKEQYPLACFVELSLLPCIVCFFGGFSFGFGPWSCKQQIHC